jgi:hypothetical protein
MKSSVLPMDVAERIAKDVIADPQGMPGAGAEEILALPREFAGITLSSDAAIPNLAQIQDEMDKVWTRRKGSFFEGIGFRLTRTRKE